MKFKEQFFSTYEDAVKAMNPDFIMNDTITDGANVTSREEAETACYEGIELTLSPKELVMSDIYCDHGEPGVCRKLTMNSGKTGIAKLMFRYDIPLQEDVKGAGGGVMIENLFDTLIELGIDELIEVFLALNISFTYEV